MNPASTQSRVRFGVRTLMGAVLFACILSGCIAPVLRAQPARLQRELYFTLGICVAIAIFSAALLCWRRLALEKLSGNEIADLRPKNPWTTFRVNGFVIALHIFLIVSASYVLLPTIPSTADVDIWPELLWTIRLELLAVFAIPILALTFFSVLAWWDLTVASAELRELGIIYSAIFFIPWSQVSALSWTKAKWGYLLRMKTKTGEIKTLVPFDKKDEIDAILMSQIDAPS